MNMTAKQRRFVEEYLIDLNATQAAIRAGYSEKTAQQVGSENLLKPVIKQAIDEALAKRSKTVGRKASDVLRDMQEIAQAAKDSFFDEPNPKMASVALKALELEGKHLGMFTDKVELTGPGGKDLNPPSFTVVFSDKKDDED